MFKPYYKEGEWCFVDARYRKKYFKGNLKYINITKQRCKIVAHSYNDFIKHEYYKHFFDEDKDKKWIDFFIGD